MTLNWEPDFLKRAPLFDPLRAATCMLRLPRWPDCDDLNRILAARALPVITAGGQPLRFVAQQARQRIFEDKFEPRTYLRGEVQLRPANWHDLFNAFVWLTFPCAKAALNARHFHALVRQREEGALNRGATQDALSLFDEGGIVVAAADLELGQLLEAHQWKALFWQRRAAVMARMRFYVFGHALYEKALQPFTGVTGRGLIFSVADGFASQPLPQQLAELDRQLAAWLIDPTRFLATSELAAVPVLGVPGWCPANVQETYYDDVSYFRPRRMTSVSG